MGELMSPMQTIQAPVTGREVIGDAGEPVAALAQFCRAIIGRDLALMVENLDHSEDVAMDDPLGRVGDRWHQIHHHGSIDNPQLLSAYQQAVR
jgi:hypothetical protein